MGSVAVAAAWGMGHGGMGAWQAGLQVSKDVKSTIMGDDEPKAALQKWTHRVPICSVSAQSPPCELHLQGPPRPCQVPGL